MHTYTHTHTVTVKVKSREIEVKGPRGTLKKSFKHMSLEITKVGKNRLRLDIWFATRKQMACLGTVKGHIMNMFKGVLYVSVYVGGDLIFLVYALSHGLLSLIRYQRRLVTVDLS